MSWKSLIDNKLAQVFNAQPDREDKRPAKRRDGAVAQIDVALAALKNGEAKGPRGWYVTRGDVVQATLRSGPKRVSIDGEDSVYVPKERAVDFYTHLRTAVAAGEFDAAVASAWSGDQQGQLPMQGEKKQRAKRGPMSAEDKANRKVKQDATRAKNKAKKAAEAKAAQTA